MTAELHLKLAKMYGSAITPRGIDEQRLQVFHRIIASIPLFVVIQLAAERSWYPARDTWVQCTNFSLSLILRTELQRRGEPGV